MPVEVWFAAAGGALLGGLLLGTAPEAGDWAAFALAFGAMATAIFSAQHRMGKPLGVGASVRRARAETPFWWAVPLAFAAALGGFGVLAFLGLLSALEVVLSLGLLLLLYRTRLRVSEIAAEAEGGEEAHP